jgi:hypothetical protein
LYRDAEKRMGGTGSKGYVSPWEIKQIKSGKTRLEKGLIFVQREEKRKGASHEMIKQWIEQKNEAIGKARGKRRSQLIIERGRLERML